LFRPRFLFDSFNTIGCCRLGTGVVERTPRGKAQKNADSDSAGNYGLNYIGMRMKKYPRQFPTTG